MPSAPLRTSKSKRLAAGGSYLETLSLKTTRPSKALIPRARTFVAVTASTRTMLTGVSNYAVYHGQRTKAL